MTRLGARTIAALRRDARGAALVEFALIAPVLIVTLLGLLDLSYNIYVTSILEGAIQKAGREATLESGGLRASEIDDRLRDAVDDLVLNPDMTFERRFYSAYDDVARPEDFTDGNSDGECNDGEPFEDINGNGTWDSDRGQSGNGGARDAVLYTVTVSYPRLFPFMGVIGFSDTVTARARTILRNQPFGQQNSSPSVGNCT